MSYIDYVDFEILNALKKDARQAYSKIAESLKISNSLVHQRIKKMKNNGLIIKSDLILDEKILGYNTKSYVGIRLKQARFAAEVVEELKKIGQIKECNYVSGKYAIFVLIFTKDNDGLRSVLYDKIHEIPGVAGTDSFICFSTNFNRSVPLIFDK